MGSHPKYPASLVDVIKASLARTDRLERITSSAKSAEGDVFDPIPPLSQSITFSAAVPTVSESGRWLAPMRLVAVSFAATLATGTAAGVTVNVNGSAVASFSVTPGSPAAGPLGGQILARDIDTFSVSVTSVSGDPTGLVVRVDWEFRG